MGGNFVPWEAQEIAWFWKVFENHHIKKWHFFWQIVNCEAQNQETKSSLSLDSLSLACWLCGHQWGDCHTQGGPRGGRKFWKEQNLLLSLDSSPHSPLQSHQKENLNTKNEPLHKKSWNFDDLLFPQIFPVDLGWSHCCGLLRSVWHLKISPLKRMSQSKPDLTTKSALTIAIVMRSGRDEMHLQERIWNTII